MRQVKIVFILCLLGCYPSEIERKEKDAKIEEREDQRTKDGGIEEKREDQRTRDVRIEEGRDIDPKEEDTGGFFQCTPGSKRWCHGPEFGPWGRQLCRPDGTFAQPGDSDYANPSSPYRCKEDLIVRPNTKCACRSWAFFNEACCEDQEDRDKDGHPDCLVPKDHKNPECKITGKLCSYCTEDEDCGGPKDLCIYDARKLSVFCGRDCTDTPCPRGYKCEEITHRELKVKQCVPISGSCGNY